MGGWDPVAVTVHHVIGSPGRLLSGILEQKERMKRGYVGFERTIVKKRMRYIK